MELANAINTLAPAVVACWQQIGHDVLQCAAECGDEVDNEEAVEACLDADRLLLVCNNKDAHTLHKELCKQYSYSVIIKQLAAQIQLV